MKGEEFALMSEGFVLPFERSKARGSRSLPPSARVENPQSSTLLASGNPAADTSLPEGGLGRVKGEEVEAWGRDWTE